jgi:hypothetical protein
MENKPRGMSSTPKVADEDVNEATVTYSIRQGY